MSIKDIFNGSLPKWIAVIFLIAGCIFTYMQLDIEARIRKSQDNLIEKLDERYCTSEKVYTVEQLVKTDMQNIKASINEVKELIKENQKDIKEIIKQK